MTEEKELTTQVLTVAEGAGRLTVTDQPSFETAGRCLVSIKGMAKEIVSFFEPMKKKAAESHKTIVAAEKSQLAPLLAAETVLKDRMAVWEQAEAARLAEENRKALAEARRAAEDAMLAEAAAMEAEGDQEGAEALLVAPVVPFVIPTQAAPRTAGVGFRYQYSVEISDFKALIEAVVAGKAPMTAIIPNQQMLDGVARSTGGAVTYPGCRVVSRRVVSARGA